MTEQIKYEAVFGDQSLFDGCIDEFAYLVIKTSYGQKFTATHETINGVIPDYIETCGLEIAMRRIIRTPVWTKEDQKAEKLPEVGCKVMVSPNMEATVTAVDTEQKVIAVQCDNQALDILRITEILPIETEAERQWREKYEWAAQAEKMINDDAEDYCVVSPIILRRLYQWMASGELKIPEVKK